MHFTSNNRINKIRMFSVLLWTVFLFFGSNINPIANAQTAEKVTSPGGYAHLMSKARTDGRVKIIVGVVSPFKAEPFLSGEEVQIQRSMIADIQDRLMADLSFMGLKSEDTYKFKYTPHLAMTVSSDVLDTLLASPNVDSIQEDIPVPPTLNLSVPRIGASQLQASGINGSGVTVAILDTGVDKDHPFLQNSVVSEACYSTHDPAHGVYSNCLGNATESTAVDSARPYVGNCAGGYCGHGTHVAGIVAGRNSVPGSPGPGVAPGASIIAIQIFSFVTSESYCGTGQAPCVLTYTSDQMKGLERVYALRNTYNIASVNMSLGGGGYSGYCDSDSRKADIDNLRAANIATVIASGNSYYCGYISAPACISSAISVGATDDSDQVPGYSNSASILSLFAPGSSINSSIPRADGGGYQSWNGTSMATPHVAGAWALIRQGKPWATVTGILNALRSTGLSVTDSGCTSVTKKRINVNEAYNATTPPPPEAFSKTSPANGAVGQATSLTLSWGSSTGATSYQYCIDTTNNSSCDGTWVSTGSSPSVSLSLAQGTIYYWQIRAINAYGTTDANSSAWWSLTTTGPPPAPSPITPWGTISLTSPTFYWNPQPTATQYTLWVNDSTGNRVNTQYYSWDVGCASWMTGFCSATPAVVLASGSGWWHVQAGNSYGVGPWSSNVLFTIASNSPKMDFDGDGNADLLWKNKLNGNISVWHMNGSSMSSSAVIAYGVPLDWQIMWSGDLNNDGKTDILWRNKANGNVAIWNMNGDIMSSSVVIFYGMPLDWEIVGTGDFNNDKKADILWRNKANGNIAIWTMNGNTLSSSAVIANGVPLDWEITGTKDFNNDGMSDILWRNKANGNVAIWNMNGNTVSSSTVIANGVPLDWEIAGTGDFNNDGMSDILWRNKANGNVSIWHMNGNTLSSSAIIFYGMPLDWVIVGTGDFNNDGRTDILWRNKANGNVAIWNMNGNTVSSSTVVAYGVPLDYELIGR